MNNFLSGVNSSIQKSLYEPNENTEVAHIKTIVISKSHPGHKILKLQHTISFKKVIQFKGETKMAFRFSLCHLPQSLLKQQKERIKLRKRNKNTKFLFSPELNITFLALQRKTHKRFSIFDLLNQGFVHCSKCIKTVAKNYLVNISYQQIINKQTLTCVYQIRYTGDRNYWCGPRQFLSAPHRTYIIYVVEKKRNQQQMYIINCTGRRVQTGIKHPSYTGNTFVL
eukprot:TRINITY_DN10642_c0_g1_i3.p1 TRINITY_DN10642_c0_g1~~TRINITY_DN10642_c0_g1_i3.p1  ORF type:complete len:225 (-),score=-4.78 TRINITY_DN10642_c0_g1_i3:27-701(-)